MGAAAPYNPSMEPHPSQLSNDERRSREGPTWRVGLMVSVLLHALVLLYFPARSVLIPSTAAAGPRAGDQRAAAGGMQAVTLRTPLVPPVTPPPIPLPTLTDMEPVEFEPETTLEAASIQGDIPGPDVGPGMENGTGEGDGGDAEEGRFRVVPPRLMGVTMPTPPDDDRIRGREVDVWVFVDERGQVVPDSTRLRPPTPNRDYNRRLVRDAAVWSFEPATREGRAVASWTRVSYRVGG